MNILSRYKFSLTVISLVVCPLVVSFLPLPQVVLGAEVQELRSDLGLVAQVSTTSKTEEDRILKSCRDHLTNQKNQEALLSCQQAASEFRASNHPTGEWKALFNIGIAYDYLAQYQKAIDFYQQSLAIARQIKNRQGEVKGLGNLGNAYYSLGKYDKAIEFHLQFLAIAREIKDRSAEGSALGNLGLAYDALGKYDKAIESYLNFLAISREIKDRRSEGAALGALGLIHNSLRKYDKVVEFYLQFLTILRETKDRGTEGSTLAILGVAYDALGKYDKAIEYLLQGLTIKREINDRQGEGIALGSLGNVYRSLSKYNKAIEAYLQSIVIAQEIKNRLGEGEALGNLGSTYYFLGNYEKAIEFHLQSLAIAREIKNRSGEGASLGSLGSAYASLGKYEKAIEFHLQSLVIAREIKNRLSEGNALGNLGTVYQTLGRYDKAIEYHLQGVEIARELKDRLGEGKSLGNLGIAYSYLGKYDKAIKFYLQSLEIAREIKDSLGDGSSLNNLGLAYLSSNNLASAEQTLRAGIQVWESIRSTSGNDSNKVSIFENQSVTYLTLQRVLIAQKQANAALEISERGRARALVELLASNLQRNESNSQENKLPLNIAEIQQIAKDHQTTLVEYSIVYDRFKIEEKQKWQQSELYIWVVTPNGQINFRSVDLKPLWQKQTTSLSELVENSRKGIGVNDRDSTGIKIVLNPEYRQQLRQEQSKYLRQLHQILIEPIADLLPTDPNARVVFMPQGALYLVPFAALQDKSEQYLIQKHTIAISPSIQVLSLTQQQRLALPSASTRSSQNILIAGNPVMPKVFVPGIDQPLRLDDLQGAQKEAIAVANTLKTTALTGSQATKKAVVQQMQSARIIHLATHGLLDDFKGMGVPGAIALAPDGNGSTNDGLLTADEILGMKLKAELVVLSACNTGRGKITGDGVIGLSRSLISAGVPSIIVSLWSVPDAPTAELMSDFYTLLEQNPDKAQALRQAMLKTMKTHPDPRDWAAFTLIGES